MSDDDFFVIEPDDAERLHLGRTRWFAERIPDHEGGVRETALTVDESLWQEARSIALLADTMREAGIDPTAAIYAGYSALATDDRITRFVTRLGHPEDW